MTSSANFYSLECTNWHTVNVKLRNTQKRMKHSSNSKTAYIQVDSILTYELSFFSTEFKKVTWPPKDGDDEGQKDNPQATVQLKDEMALNDEAWKPTGTYKAAPTIYAEQPAQLNEDVWPPPEPMGKKVQSVLVSFQA